MRYGAAAVVVLGMLLASTSVVDADHPTPGQAGNLRGLRPDLVETDVVATNDGVTIYVGIRATRPGSSGSPGASDLISGPATPTCTAQALNVPFDSATNGWMRDGLREIGSASRRERGGQ